MEVLTTISSSGCGVRGCFPSQLTDVGNGCGQGANMTFTPCNYVPDPETEKWEAAKKARLAALPRGPGFKVLGGIRTWYTRGVNHFATEARHKPDVEIIN